MSVEERLNFEQLEDIEALTRHRGLPILLAIVDDIVEKLRNEVLSVPLPADPEKASLVLYSKRASAEGAVSLRTALVARLMKLKEGQK